MLSHGDPEKIGARIGQPSQPKSQQCIINPYQRGFAHLPQPDQNTGRVGDRTGCSKSRCNFGVMQRFVIKKQDTKKCQRKNSLSAYQPTAGLFGIQKRERAAKQQADGGQHLILPHAGHMEHFVQRQKIITATLIFKKTV